MIVDAWEGACSLTISPVLPYLNPANSHATHLGLVFADFAWETSELNRETTGQSNIDFHRQQTSGRHCH
jgi:hypothetical protein